MAADDDVADAQMAHGVLDHRRGAQVRGVQHVGDVAVDEDVAGLEAQHGCFRASRVGAADPENLGLLARG